MRLRFEIHTVMTLSLFLRFSSVFEVQLLNNLRSGKRRKFYSERIHNFYSPSIITVTK